MNLYCTGADLIEHCVLSVVREKSRGTSILAEFGTLHLEFAYLTQISGNQVYMDKVQTAVDPPNYTLLPTDLPVLNHSNVFLSWPYVFVFDHFLCSIADNSAHWLFCQFSFWFSHENFLQSHTLVGAFAQRSWWNSFQSSNGLGVFKPPCLRWK